MKKILGLLMVMGLMVSFGGCGDKGPQGLPIQAYWGEGPQVKLEGNKKDGKEDGKWVSYYENGQIRSETNYKDGKQEGKEVSYYENGQIRSEGNYTDGKQEG